MRLALSGAIADVQAGKVFGCFKQSRIGAGAGAEVHRAAVKIAAKLRDVTGRRN
jgi:hypothetical protein